MAIAEKNWDENIKARLVKRPKEACLERVIRNHSSEDQYISLAFMCSFQFFSTTAVIVNKVYCLLFHHFNNFKIF